LFFGQSHGNSLDSYSNRSMQPIPKSALSKDSEQSLDLSVVN